MTGIIDTVDRSVSGMTFQVAKLQHMKSRFKKEPKVFTNMHINIRLKTNTSLSPGHILLEVPIKMYYICT